MVSSSSSSSSTPSYPDPLPYDEGSVANESTESDGTTSLSGSAYLSAQHLRSRLNALASLSTELEGKRSTFRPPSNLVFQPSSTHESPKLAFGSAANAVLLSYEEYLVKMLTRLDGIESEGDEMVRRNRKEIVRTVESELERIDQYKKDMWERQSIAAAAGTAPSVNADQPEKAAKENMPSAGQKRAATGQNGSPQLHKSSASDTTPPTSQYRQVKHRKPSDEIGSPMDISPDRGGLPVKTESPTSSDKPLFASLPSIFD